MTDKEKEFKKLSNTLVKLIFQYKERPNMFLKIRIKLVKNKLSKLGI